MGVGPHAVGLYHQMKILGLFDGVTNIVELGSQNMGCNQLNSIASLYEKFGKPPPDETTLKSFVNGAGRRGLARTFYEGLGFSYTSVDIDGESGAKVMDLNFDSAPDDMKGKFCFTTNHGTTEHLINQMNAFNVMHDFTRKDGLMFNFVPFQGFVEHGFFNYHPNFFEALARFNSYETLGSWMVVDTSYPHMIPYHPNLMDKLILTSKSVIMFATLTRKLYDADFCCPFQGMYEGSLEIDSSHNYCMVVDGDLFDLKRRQYITGDKVAEPPIPRHKIFQRFSTKEITREIIQRLIFRSSKLVRNIVGS
jgi:hypothetical protein